MIKKKVIPLVLLFLVVTNSLSEEISKNQDQVNLISKNLRCLICQGQSVFDSDSDFATSMKLFISQKIDEGYLEDEIYSLLIKKYGQWIVYDPGLSKNTFLLWLIPLLLFILGGVIISIKLYKFEKK
tara:strand:- start:24 stop:404 length:381 start_codon:yes stop_codon:yes gene_type:complete